MAESDDEEPEFRAVQVTVGQWRSVLGAPDAARGIYAVHKNVRRLFQDAVTLLEVGSDASAVTMGLVALEESAKIGWLRLMPGQDAGDKMQSMWEEFEGHEGTGGSMPRWLRGALRGAQLGKSQSAQVLSRIAGIGLSDLADVYDHVRVRATHVECTEGAERWSLPELAIGRELAMTLLDAIYNDLILRVTSYNIKLSVDFKAIVDDEYAEVEAWDLAERDEEESIEWANAMRSRLAKLAV